MPAALHVAQDADPLSEQLVPQLQCSVHKVLDEARALVSSEIHEARHTSESVLRRLELVARETATTVLTATLVATQRFVAIVNAFVAFLNTFGNQGAALRIAHNRVVLRRLLQFHRDIDHLLDTVNVLRAGSASSDELVAWKDKWKAYQNEQFAALEQLSINREALIRDDPQDTLPHSEALELLWFEYNKEHAGYTSAKRTVLRSAFDIIRRQVTRSPEPALCLLPPYELEYDEIPFAWGPLGTAHHGRFDDHSAVVKRVRIVSESDRESFAREMNNWHSVNQLPQTPSNIAQLYGAYHFGLTPFFVCEYAANGTLMDYLFDESVHQQTW